MINDIVSDDDDTVDGEDSEEVPQTSNIQNQHTNMMTGDALQDPNTEGGDGDADEELDDENAAMFGGYGAPLH